MYTLKRNNVMTVSGRDRSKRNGENSRVRDKDDRREREREVKSTVDKKREWWSVRLKILVKRDRIVKREYE